MTRHLGPFYEEADFLKTKLDFFLNGHVGPPREIGIELNNTCNLQCPLCETGRREGPPPARVNLAEFQTLLSKIPKPQKMRFYTWGEPFLNADTLKIIRYASERGITTIIHSHFSLKRDGAFFEELALSGLDHLYLSIDGATQEVYEKFRKGGRLDLVLNNIRELVNAKKRLNRATPRIVYKMLVSKKNEHEVDRAEKLASDLGVEFLTNSLHLEGKDELQTAKNEEEWAPSQAKNQWKSEHTTCPHLFGRATISPDGKVFPCPHVSQKDEAPWGDLKAEDFDSIWNGDKYRTARRLFVPHKEKGENEPKLPCHNCKIYPPRGKRRDA